MVIVGSRHTISKGVAPGRNVGAVYGRSYETTLSPMDSCCPEIAHRVSDNGDHADM